MTLNMLSGIGELESPAMRKRTIALVSVIALSTGLLLYGLRDLFIDDYTYEVSEKFKRVELDRPIPLNSLIKGDTLCVVPWGYLAFAYLRAEFPNKRVKRPDEHESERKWYILAIDDDDKFARVFDVYRYNVDFVTEPERTMCSRNLVIQVRHDSVRRVVSVVKD